MNKMSDLHPRTERIIKPMHCINQNVLILECRKTIFLRVLIKYKRHFFYIKKHRGHSCTYSDCETHFSSPHTMKPIMSAANCVYRLQSQHYCWTFDFSELILTSHLCAFGNSENCKNTCKPFLSKEPIYQNEFLLLIIEKSSDFH